MKAPYAARKVACLIGIALATAGCYHAVIDTGLAPGTQVIDKQWASSFIYGLVPPSVVETASKCPHGVARVETQLSFLNQLVSFLTLGIYTPMRINVTCAATGGMADGTPSESGTDFTVVLARAIQRSIATGAAVNVVTTR